MSPLFKPNQMITHWIKTKDGKEWPIRFTQAVTNQLAVDENVPLNQIGKFLGTFGEWPIGRVYKFYKLAFKSGARKEGKEFDMTDEEFIEWMSEDDAVMEGINRVMLASHPDPVEQKKTKGKG